jgi:hypothetical protein
MLTGSSCSRSRSRNFTKTGAGAEKKKYIFGSTTLPGSLDLVMVCGYSRCYISQWHRL